MWLTDSVETLRDGYHRIAKDPVDGRRVNVSGLQGQTLRADQLNTKIYTDGRDSGVNRWNRGVTTELQAMSATGMIQTLRVALTTNSAQATIRGQDSPILPHENHWTPCSWGAESSVANEVNSNSGYYTTKL